MWNETNDLALAIQLQQDLNSQFDGFGSDGTKRSTHKRKSNAYNAITGEKPQNLSLVDPQWELIDPNPDVRILFLEFNEKYFWGRLSCVEVRWSPRMTLCAGLCVYEGRGGLCSVRLSTPLLKLRPRKDLIETLLHEMIHAYLFVTDNNKDHDGHGPEFHKHMHRLNKETGTNISVYHDFHDEVDSYKQHWWRCDGTCRTKPPYFGYVKRAMNRAPSANDFWWPSHQQQCGGTYTKVKEPEGYGQKKNKKKGGSNDEKKSNNGKDIRDMLASKNKNVAASKSSTNNSKSTSSKSIDATGNLSLQKENGKNFTSSKTSNTNSTGVNLAGFKHDNRTRDLDVYKGLSLNSQKCFTGDGRMVGGSQNSSTGSGDRIVRKLPGIGIIETERKPNVDSKACLAECVSDEENDDLVIFSPTSQKYTSNSKTLVKPKSIEKTDSPSASIMNRWLNKSHNNANNINSKTDQYDTLSGNTTCTLDISDSDNEFDKSLKLYAKSKKLKRKSSVTSLENFLMQNGQIEVGSFISVPGFKSVSGKRNTPSRDDTPVLNTKLSEMEQPDKRDFTSCRNKRAHDLISISDNSGDEMEINELESQTLASIAHKKKKRTLSADQTSNAQYTCATVSDVNSSSSTKQENKPVTFVNQGKTKVSVGGATFPDNIAENMVDCPVCSKKISSQLINQHLDTCLCRDFF